MKPPLGKLEIHDGNVLIKIHVFHVIYLMVVPLKVCIVGTHWMQSLICIQQPTTLDTLVNP